MLNKVGGCRGKIGDICGKQGESVDRVEGKVASHSVSDCAGGPVVLSRRVSVEDDGEEDDDEDDCDAGEPPPQTEVSFCGEPARVEVPDLAASCGVHQWLYSHKLGDELEVEV